MDDGLIFNVKLTTLLAYAALTFNLAVFAILTCYVCGSLKILDFAILDANVLTTPVISDRTTQYMGRLLSNMRHIEVVYDDVCESTDSDAYAIACNYFHETFGPMEGPITRVYSGVVAASSYNSHLQTLETAYGLSIMALSACFVFGILHTVRYKKLTILWVFANWANAMSAGFGLSFATVLSSYRAMIKDFIWARIPKTYPYILMKYDDLDNLCWACAGLCCISILISALTGLVQCVPLASKTKPIVRGTLPPVDEQHMSPKAIRSGLFVGESSSKPPSSDSSSSWVEQTSGVLREIELPSSSCRQPLCLREAGLVTAPESRHELYITRRTKSDPEIDRLIRENRCLAP